MTVRDVVALAGMGLSLDAAFFLTRAIRPPTRSELQDLGSGAILESDYAGLFFGIRSELVRAACMEWEYDRTGMVVLCLSVAAQALSLIIPNSHHLPIFFALCVPFFGVALTLVAGRLLADWSTAAYIERMVIAEIQRDRSLRQTPPVHTPHRDDRQDDLKEVQFLVRRLLSGLTSDKAINKFTLQVQALLDVNGGSRTADAEDLPRPTMRDGTRDREAMKPR